MAELPEHYRIVLVLFDLENHSYDEVAELLSLPLGTVKSRLNRARLALRDKLESEWELFRD
jgi:RNA polymerase sigma-70 factor (ECF subfamily)